VLTNGIRYRFYTDVNKQNILDEKPFLEFDVTDMKEKTLFPQKLYELLAKPVPK
jgi:hypothetical protein